MSAILSADDLNDFISPGVACIKPVETLPAAPPAANGSSIEELEHEVILDGGSQTTGNSSANAPAQISLTDCLACSGCVTSAEAVLVSLQSHSEVLSTLDGAPGLRVVEVEAGDAEEERDGNDGATDTGNAGNKRRRKWRVEGLEDPDAKLFVTSVSPQSRASLAAVVGGEAGRKASSRDAGYMIDQLLSGTDGLCRGGKHGNGFTWVVDTNAAREMCLVLGADEALSDTGNVDGSGSNTTTTPIRKPILTSSCPGWVCYAEKTHPHVLPHLSRIKSAQALMGTLLKSTLSALLDIPPHRIWHLAVMPCFDKKLEASRGELTDAAWRSGSSDSDGTSPVRDVDCVITSKEVLMLAETRGIDFFALPKSPVSSSSPFHPAFPDTKLSRFLSPPPASKHSHQNPQRPEAGTSDGFLYTTLQSIVSSHPGSRLQTTRGRNADVVEYAVLPADPSAPPILRAARYYGFRNIQNLVRRLRPARPSRVPGGRAVGRATRTMDEYCIVEVMACPGGCTNGGGQVKVDDAVVVERVGLVGGEGMAGTEEQKVWLGLVDEAYFSGGEDEGGGVVVVGGHEEDVYSAARVRATLEYWAGLVGVAVEKLTQTSFREVVSDVGKGEKGALTDTERIVQLAGRIGGGW